MLSLIRCRDRKVKSMKLIFALILSIFISVSAFGQAKGSSSVLPKDEQELRTLVKKWNDAELKGDAATIASLLADEFSFVGGSNRSQYLKLMKPDPSLVVESNDVEDLQVQLYQDVAIITGLNLFRLKKDGKPFAGKFYTMSAWVKRNGRWQIVKACLRPASD